MRLFRKYEVIEKLVVLDVHRRCIRRENILIFSGYVPDDDYVYEWFFN